ncbi:MAG TPA: DNA-formamidopyrimidine glycosylase family protein [Anaerolineaceae bacterium]|nr:DNA-formamidopyrimidine glycosylase family protein [Anaerolineaceae bacterium]
MPELPELEVVCEVLQRRVVGQTIQAVSILPPGRAVVVRDLTGQSFQASLTGAAVLDVTRRGKFLLFAFDRPLTLALNPKLAGRLQLAAPAEKRRAKTHVVFSLSGGGQLRYLDPKLMGQLYLTTDLNTVPDYAGMGPEALEISPEDFRKRIKPCRGEIKGVLTRGDFVAGIGNAYADEILWEARLHPYRKRTQLTAEEIDRLYAAMRTTLLGAVEKVRQEMGERIEEEPRGFMAVHMKTSQPCPRCGTAISLVGANQRITNFCRACRPGGLIKGMWRMRTRLRSSRPAWNKPGGMFYM